MNFEPVKGDDIRYTNEEIKKDKIDPDKFKDMMKLDETDESSRRKKRKMRTSEEDRTDDDIKDPSDFSKYMEDDNRRVFESNYTRKQSVGGEDKNLLDEDRGDSYVSRNNHVEDDSWESGDGSKGINFKKANGVKRDDYESTKEDKDSILDAEGKRSGGVGKDKTSKRKSKDASLLSSQTLLKDLKVKKQNNKDKDSKKVKEEGALLKKSSSLSKVSKKEKEETKGKVGDKKGKVGDKKVGLQSSKRAVKKDSKEETSGKVSDKETEPRTPKRAVKKDSKEETEVEVGGKKVKPWSPKRAVKKDSKEEVQDIPQEGGYNQPSSSLRKPAKSVEIRGEVVKNQSNLLKQPAENNPSNSLKKPVGKLKDEVRKDNIEKKAEKKSIRFLRKSPDEIRREKILSKPKQDVKSSFASGVLSSKQQDNFSYKKDKFTEASENTGGIIISKHYDRVKPSGVSEEKPSYVKMDPDVYELFEKMSGVMLIQENSGITTTTFTLNMQNSVFNGAQIILEKYSTAPNSFNVTLNGQPEAVNLFASNIEALRQAFKQANYDFEVNILSPVIISDKKSGRIVKRKDSSGESKDHDQNSKK